MKKNFLMCLFAIVTIASCKKHLGDPQNKPIPPPAVPPKEAWIAGMNKEIATILETVYQNDSAYYEVNATIFSGYYADEKVLLKDLLFPESSELYQSESFRKLGVQQGIFRRVFNEVLDSGDFPIVKEAIARESGSQIIPKTLVIADNAILPDASFTIFSGGTASSIYFPYSENFTEAIMSKEANVPQVPRTTLVTADRDADVAPGRAPFSCSVGSSKICYRNVLVTDEYAYISPTHIIQNGARPAKDFIGVVPPSGVPVTKVFLGWARLTKQMDKLVSFTGNGGGSEIKVARLSGYLQKKDEQVTSFDGDQISLEYSRGDIRKQRWKRIYAAWDPDWKNEKLEQVFAVYEDDTKGTKTFSGSLNTTLSLTGSPTGKVQGEIAFKVEVTTQDDIIIQRKLERASFLRDGLSNQGWGYFPDPTDIVTMSKSWPVYDGGTIWQFTLPWKIG